MEDSLLLWSFSVLLSCSVFWYAVGFLITSILVKVLVLLLFIIYVIVPVVYKNSYSIQKVFLFLNFAKWPPNFDLTKPSDAGLQGTRNFYIIGEENVRLGTWHILPSSLIPEANQTSGEQEDRWNGWLANGRPVIVYAHGNSGHRGASHRMQLYHVLQKKDYHVIAFDYRGYGDSSNIPINETGLVSDLLSVYKWVQKKTNKSVFIWGHSLGTGISSHVLSVLHSENNEPDGLILEAPFNNLRDEVKDHPFARIYSFLPWFDYFFTTPMYENGLRFQSDQYLSHTTAPVLILHAKDDQIIPYHLGVRLYHSVLASRGNNSDTVEMVSFEADKHYGHKFICEDPGLPNVIDNFVEKCVNRRNDATS